MNEDGGFHLSVVIAQNNTCIVDTGCSITLCIMYGGTGLKCALQRKLGGGGVFVMQPQTTASQLAAPFEKLNSPT